MLDEYLGTTVHSAYIRPSVGIRNNRPYDASLEVLLDLAAILRGERDARGIILPGQRERPAGRSCHRKYTGHSNSPNDPR